MSASQAPEASGEPATVLERIIAETREELARRRLRAPLAGSAPRDGGRPGLGAALRAPAIGVIAEFKRRSPSAGAIGARTELASTIAAYAAGGAVALSILTEEPNFGGSLEDLRRTRELTALPLLRKDFIVDDYQLHEAADAGADAVLLIVAALERTALHSLHGHARELGLDVLVEVHDRAELQLALELGAELIGINNRDLRDFSVDLSRTETLMGDVPAGVTVVSESGIASAAQLRRLAECGVAAVLVGESLMRAPDPAAVLRQLLAGAREV